MAKRYPNLSDDPSESVKAKLRAFADLYRGGPDEVRGNATSCYMQLHPRCKRRDSAESKAHGYYNHPYTQAILQEKAKESCSKADITESYILQKIKDTVERCSQARPVTDKAGNHVMVETEDGELVPAYTFDAANVLRGCELMGKNLALWTDKQELSGSVAYTIETAIPRDPDDPS